LYANWGETAGRVEVADAILALGLVLSGILLAFTTYAALYGLAGAITGRTYERCPNCHHHYLADKGRPTAHECYSTWWDELPHAIHSLAVHGHHAPGGRG
jgi:hypothetical protein